jgi:hypothetical protein
MEQLRQTQCKLAPNADTRTAFSEPHHRSTFSGIGRLSLLAPPSKIRSKFAAGEGTTRDVAFTSDGDNNSSPTTPPTRGSKGDRNLSAPSHDEEAVAKAIALAGDKAASATPKGASIRNLRAQKLKKMAQLSGKAASTDVLDVPAVRARTPADNSRALAAKVEADRRADAEAAIALNDVVMDDFDQETVLSKSTAEREGRLKMLFRDEQGNEVEVLQEPDIAVPSEDFRFASLGLCMCTCAYVHECMYVCVCVFSPSETCASKRFWLCYCECSC